MAIKDTVNNTRFGRPIEDAYIKFCYAFWSDMDQEGKLQFSVWSSPTAEAEGLVALAIIDVPTGTIFNGIQEKAYAEIKKHPNYLSAIDV